MKNFFLCLFALQLTVAWAQDPKSLPSLNAIRTPNSPAFSVLGVQPTSVERPNTPADLAVAIDNATEGFKKFPKNFSLEFSPYWMSKEPMALSWRDDINRSVEASLVRTFSASLATTSKEVNTKEVRGLSYGFRTFLLSGKTSDKSVAAIEALEKKLTAFSAQFAEVAAAEERSVQLEFFRKIREATDDAEKETAKQWFEEQRKRIQVSKEKWLKEEDAKMQEDAQAFAPQREGLFVEIAYAAAYHNDTVNADLRKGGYAFWVTPSYVTGDYSLVGVYRQLKDSLSNKSSEYGIRFLYTKERYAVSLEYLKGEYQNETPLPNRERFSLLFEYLLNENLWVSMSLGEDNKNIQGTQSIFSTLGIRYNFSRDRYSFK
jgi:hypothetical protein